MMELSYAPSPRLIDPLARVQAALAGRYTIERELGRGGMATVYLAQDRKHHRPVAIKVLKPELAAALGPERFLREIDTAARLTHPHILPLHDSGEAAGLLYYVMPYVEGETLRDRLEREGQLPLEEAVRITREVASALSYAHSHDVVHRDIKPENILLSGGEAVVADFGIARAITAAARGQLTETGIAIGTPGYMSPEQGAASARVDERSDIYSLGCVLYEMLAGEPPFTGPSAESIVRQHLAAAPPRVSAMRAAVPPAIEEAIMRALAKTPADRFATAAEFAGALAAPAQRMRDPGRRTSRLAVGAGLAATLVAAAAGLFVLSRPHGTPALAGPTSQSIAVLPFVNVSGAPQEEYLSDGISEELINALSKLPQLQVVARPSSFAFKGKNEDVRQIGQALQVATVLGGSVRRVANRLRVTAQLTDARNGYNLWSETYDRQMGDVFAVEDEISHAIMRALQVHLVSGDSLTLSRRPTHDVEAYELYLKGRYFYNKGGFGPVEQALAYFQQALAHDSNYALAYGGIADAYQRLTASTYLRPREGMPKARAAVLKALAIVPSRAGAHASLGDQLCVYDWDASAAERELRRAIELNPSVANAHYFYSHCLTAHRRSEEALAEARRAHELDPLNPEVATGLPWALYGARRYDEAIAGQQKSLDLEPGFAQAHMLLALSLAGKGSYAEALAEARKMAALAGDAPSFVGILGYVAGRAGERAEAQRILTALERRPPGNRAFAIALVHLGLGNNEQALRWLQAAYEERAEWLVIMAPAPFLDPLRPDPRFSALMRKVGIE